MKHQYSAQNLLPYDGETLYFGKMIDGDKAYKYFENLLSSIAWKNDEAKIFGKHYITKRKAAWYGDSEFEYTYSNTTKRALAWTKELLEIKYKTEEVCGISFNSCLLNLYHSGDEGMAWHSDDEKALGRNTTIASVSLGAERRFAFRHKVSKETISTNLENGSLLVMKGTTQSNWLHSLPKTKKVTEPRINLTFRTILL
ncbi:MAG TPA: alpha-ketoglutarate-dependent dioxygenase AlkB [Flavobacterium sp.]|jgi:alkylated DNA repair dioxygenase AlkB